MTAFFDYPADSPDGGPDATPDRSRPAPELGDETVLAGITEREWSALRSRCTVERVPTSEVLVRAGEVDRSLFFVLSGELRARISKRYVGAPMVPGGVFGEVAFFDGRPRSSDVVAIHDAEVLRLSYESFTVLAATEPVLARVLLLELGRALAGRLRAAEAARGRG